MRFISAPPPTNATASLLIPPSAYTPKISTLGCLEGLHEDSPTPGFVWNSSVPWDQILSLGLALRDKLRTRRNLLRKGIIWMTHVGYAPPIGKRRRISSRTAPSLVISSTLWGSRSTRTSTTSIYTTSLDLATFSQITSPPSLCSTAGTCGKGVTTIYSGRSLPLTVTIYGLVD